MSKRFKSEKANGSIIFKIILAIILIPIVLCSLIILIKGTLFPDKIPDVFGIKPMIVMSDSMESYISRGDLVFVKITKGEDLKKQDIIAYRLEGENYVITHRIVDIKQENGEYKFETKGDNNNSADGTLVRYKEVEGKYINKIPKLGAFLMFLQDPKGLVIVLLIVLIVGMMWINAAKDDEKEDNYRKNKDSNDDNRYTRKNDDRFEIDNKKAKH
jgi:signal peptidase